MGSSTQLVDRAAAPLSTDPGLADDTYLLSALLDHTTDRIYFKDLESRFVKVNRNKAQSLHLSDPAEAIGKTDSDFFAGNHAMERRQDELEIIQSGVPLIGKVEREDSPDGRVAWTSTSKMPLFNSTGKCIGTFGVSRDITEREEAEIALSNAHRDAELFIDSVPSILIGLDAGGRIKRWNLAAAEAFGISKAAAFGKLLGSCGIKWLRHDIDSEIRLLSTRTEPARWDLRVDKDDEERLLGFTLRWIRPFASDNAELLIVGADITERKRADEDLLWKTAFLEAQTNSTGDAILIVDAEGKKLLQNLKTQELFRIPQDIADKSDDESLLEHILGVVKDQDHFLERVRYLYEHRSQTSRDEIELVDGRVLERYSSPVLGQCDEYYGRIWTFRDVTERKRTESEKLVMEAQLRQAQKLEAIGQLAAGIAHEINTPIQYVGDNTSFLRDSWGLLAGLLAAAQKLRDEITPGSVSQAAIDSFDTCSKVADVEYLSQDIPRAIEQTLEGVQRVARIVSAMKEFSHPGSLEKRAVDLNRAIETTVTISRNEWKYVAEVRTELDPNLPLVPCLAGEINQVLLNLVVNAANAIADAPHGEGDGLGTITLSTRTDGNWAEISVADTGTGIPDHVRDRVFDPFFTTKEVGKGTGQGLMLAHAVIVKKHGGRIWFDSEVGKGTTFFVRLPISVPAET